MATNGFLGGGDPAGVHRLTGTVVSRPTPRSRSFLRTPARPAHLYHFTSTSGATHKGNAPRGKLLMRWSTLPSIRIGLDGADIDLGGWLHGRGGRSVGSERPRGREALGGGGGGVMGREVWEMQPPTTHLLLRHSVLDGTHQHQPPTFFSSSLTPTTHPHHASPSPLTPAGLRHIISLTPTHPSKSTPRPLTGAATVRAATVRAGGCWFVWPSVSVSG